METTTYPTPEQITALSMVGRVVTDGTRVGVLRMVDGPDWMVVGEIQERPAHLVTDPERVRLIYVPLLEASFPHGAYGNVRWHGTDYLTVVPLASIRKGVTLAKR